MIVYNDSITISYINMKLKILKEYIDKADFKYMERSDINRQWLDDMIVHETYVDNKITLDDTKLIDFEVEELLKYAHEVYDDLDEDDSYVSEEDKWSAGNEYGN